MARDIIVRPKVLFPYSFLTPLLSFCQKEILLSTEGESPPQVFEHYSMPTENAIQYPAPMDHLVVVQEPPTEKVMPASEVSEELFRLSGVWPFDFLPDELIIEEKRLVMKQRIFPFTVVIDSLPIDEISDFELTHSLIFSSIHIKGGTFNIIDTVFSWLHASAAQKAKDIVDGLRIKQKESVEVLDHTQRERVQTIRAMGATGG